MFNYPETKEKVETLLEDMRLGDLAYKAPEQIEGMFLGMCERYEEGDLAPNYALILGYMLSVMQRIYINESSRN